MFLENAEKLFALAFPSQKFKKFYLSTSFRLPKSVARLANFLSDRPDKISVLDSAPEGEVRIYTLLSACTGRSRKEHSTPRRSMHSISTKNPVYSHIHRLAQLVAQDFYSYRTVCVLLPSVKPIVYNFTRKHAPGYNRLVGILSENLGIAVMVVGENSEVCYGQKESARKVVFSTMHASKGMEYDAVHLCGIDDSLTLDFHGKSKCNTKIQEQVYVGLTRAKQVLRIYTCIEAHKMPYFKNFEDHFYHEVWTPPEGVSSPPRGEKIVVSPGEEILKQPRKSCNTCVSEILVCGNPDASSLLHIRREYLEGKCNFIPFQRTEGSLPNLKKIKTMIRNEEYYTQGKHSGKAIYERREDFLGIAQTHILKLEHFPVTRKGIKKLARECFGINNSSEINWHRHNQAGGEFRLLKPRDAIRLQRVGAEMFEEIIGENIFKIQEGEVEGHTVHIERSISPCSYGMLVNSALGKAFSDCNYKLQGVADVLHVNHNKGEVNILEYKFSQEEHTDEAKMQCILYGYLAEKTYRMSFPSPPEIRLFSVNTLNQTILQIPYSRTAAEEILRAHIKAFTGVHDTPHTVEEITCKIEEIV